MTPSRPPLDVCTPACRVEGGCVVSPSQTWALVAKIDTGARTSAMQRDTMRFQAAGCDSPLVGKNICGTIVGHKIVKVPMDISETRAVIRATILLGTGP